MTIAIGFDPGPTWTGVAILDRRSGAGRPIYLQRCWQVPSDVGSLRGALLEARDLGATVAAIETPHGYIHEHARGAQLIETATVAGIVTGMALERVFKVYRCSAQATRQALCGPVRARCGGVPGDAAVRRVLPMLVREIPRRTNSHERDAMLIAVLSLLNPTPDMRVDYVKVDVPTVTSTFGGY